MTWGWRSGGACQRYDDQRATAWERGVREGGGRKRAGAGRHLGRAQLVPDGLAAALSTPAHRFAVQRLLCGRAQGLSPGVKKLAKLCGPRGLRVAGFQTMQLHQKSAVNHPVGRWAGPWGRQHGAATRAHVTGKARTCMPENSIAIWCALPLQLHADVPKAGTARVEASRAALRRPDRLGRECASEPPLARKL